MVAQRVPPQYMLDPFSASAQPDGKGYGHGANITKDLKIRTTIKHSATRQEAIYSRPHPSQLETNSSTPNPLGISLLKVRKGRDSKLGDAAASGFSSA
jgi:hypothetical protein